jgi:hypothetical protein
MEPLSIPKGSTVFLGKAARPMPQHLCDAIGDLVSNIERIREAYLAQCYVAGIVDPAAEILVLVVDDLINQQNVLHSVDGGLARIMPTGMHLDVLVVNNRDKLLAMIRNLPNIRATSAQKKSSWRFGRWKR